MQKCVLMGAIFSCALQIQSCLFHYHTLEIQLKMAPKTQTALMQQLDSYSKVGFKAVPLLKIVCYH